MAPRPRERVLFIPVSLLCAMVAFGCGPSNLGTAARPPEPPTHHQSLGPVVGDTVPSEEGAEPSTAEPGWLGVELLASPSGQPGVQVREVVHGSPAERARLRSGDVLLRVHGQPVSQPDDVVRLVGEHGAGRRLNLVLRRGPEEHLVAVELTAVPSGDDILYMSYVGLRAPPLEALSAARGQPALTLGAVRGRVTVLEFWSPWCTVCRMLIPVMNDWHERYRARGVEFVAITTEAPSQAARAAAGLGMDYPVASDESERTTLAYRALALPTLFVIDPNGTVREVMVGFSRTRMRRVQATIEHLLGDGRQTRLESRPGVPTLVSAHGSR